MPTGYKWKAYGLDFGFTNDPTALVEVVYQEGKLWVKELLYETGLPTQTLRGGADFKGRTRL
jgi:phage terminase large subunit